MLRLVVAFGLVVVLGLVFVVVRAFVVAVFLRVLLLRFRLRSIRGCTEFLWVFF